MIFEGVITTRNPDGTAHVTPMGFRRAHDEVVIRPFVPSATLDNLAVFPQAVMNLTDDVRITAGCLTGQREWPLCAAAVVAGWRLEDCLAHLELEVEEQLQDRERPTFRCRIVHIGSHRPFVGFNRAQAAIIEASILVSRLDFIASEKLEAELTYLNIAVSKTAGERERTAWHWLLGAVEAHPRHQFEVDHLR
jgi:hypothetical protein